MTIDEILEWIANAPHGALCCIEFACKDRRAYLPMVCPKCGWSGPNYGCVEHKIGGRWKPGCPQCSGRGIRSLVHHEGEKP